MATPTAAPTASGTSATSPAAPSPTDPTSTTVISAPPQPGVPAPAGTTAVPSQDAAAPGDAPLVEHTFETPPPAGNKGVPTRPAISTEAYALDRRGDIKVRLALVQLADKKAAISETDARAAITTSSDYWQAESNGRLSMSVASVEYPTSKATSTQRYSDMMNTITTELGWAPSSNTALVVFVSTGTLSDGAYGAGWSYSGTSGKVIMPLPANLTKSVLSHEFGHVLGLMHANALQCTSGAVDVATNADGSFADPSCSVQEYKDNLDLMGVSQLSRPVISSPMYEYGGFGAGNEVYNIGTASGKASYQLQAWSSAADNRAVKFTDPLSGEIYYVELRLPIGGDAAAAVNGNRGVKIVQSFGAGSISLPPSTTTYYSTYYTSNAAWQAGQTFTTHAGTRVTVDWISDVAAGITIDTLPPAKPLLIAPGDFNGDGIPDVLQRKANGELWFYPGDGTGRQGAGRRIGTGWEIFDSVIGVGDFNGDGRNDLIARKWDGSLWFYAGNGSVSATSEGYSGGVKVGDFGWDAFDALLGVRDFDGDGRPDLLARRPDGVLVLYPGTATGRPGAAREIDFGWQIFDQLIALQDFNGDGTNDLAGRKPDGTLWMYSNTGQAKLINATKIGSGWGIYTTILGTGDANGDRMADMIANQPDGSVYFYAGTGMRDEGYSGGRKIGNFGWDAFDMLVATPDFNGDGIADLIARGSGGTLWFYAGNGTGSYGAGVRIGNFGWDAFNALTGVGDLDGDGRNDLIARMPDGSLWLYSGTGQVNSTSNGYAPGRKIGNFGWEAFTTLSGTGDLTGDGKNDLLARGSDGSLWVYPGTGRVDGTSSGLGIPTKIGNFGWEVFDQLFGVGDYNADGKNDVLARLPDGTLLLYPGDGAGRLSTPRKVGTGWNIYDAVRGAWNLNGDRYPDIVARRPDGSLWAYSGTGMQPNEGYLGRMFAAQLS
ncbi:FG-GAP-like repeat-containing protein [Pseudarthrobacter sp. B907]|uniref:FG-GAP-like repeat-containing protein n=1 Tax=Pseudarthrobacter sp. B907 TaxID=3158261 RepID=UPI0032DA1A8F